MSDLTTLLVAEEAKETASLLQTDLDRFLINNNLSKIIQNFKKLDTNLTLNDIITSSSDEIDMLCKLLKITLPDKLRLKTALKSLKNEIPTLNNKTIDVISSNIKNESSKNNISLRIAFFGDTNVGKSSVISRFASNKFNARLEATYYATCCTKDLEFDDFVIKFKIWDTVGAKQYRSLNFTYFKGAQCVIGVFDITDKNSLDELLERLEDAQRYVNSSSLCYGFIIVANKIDLLNENSELNKCIEFSDGFNLFVEKYGAKYYIETSAKNNINIKHLFKNVIRIIPNEDLNKFMENKQSIIVNDEEMLTTIDKDIRKELEGSSCC